MGRMRVAAAGLVMASLAVVLASPAVGATSNGGSSGGDEWPMFMGGFRHAGASQGVGPSSPAMSWTLQYGTRYSDEGMSPVVGSNGTIYLLQQHRGAHSVRLRAISPTTHKTLWSWSGAGKTFFSIPAVAPNGTVYVGIDTSTTFGLYAVKNATTLWKVPSSTFSGFLWAEPTIGPDGTVYLESEDALYALNPKNGHIYWSYTSSSGGGLTDTPTISPDGTALYITSRGGDLDALSAGPTGGQLEWTYQIKAEPGADIFNAPAVGPGGTIYLTTGGPVGNSPGYIDAVNPEGTLKWVYISNGAFETIPAVTAAGQVVAGNDVGTVVAVQRSTGTLAWSYSAPGTENGFGNSSAASDANGNIYLQSENEVFALSSEGSVLWTATDQTEWGASPALDDSGTLYVTGTLERGSGPSLIAYESSG